MTKNTLDDILLYNMLGRDTDRDSSNNNPPRKTLEDLNTFLEAKFSDNPEVLARIENLPGDLEQRAAQSMLKGGKPLDEIADWLERSSELFTRTQAKWTAKSAGSEASQTLKELGWDDRTAGFVSRIAASQAMSAKYEAISDPDQTGDFDFRQHGEMAAIRFHLSIPPEGISLYEAYESMVITDEWSDGQVREIDVVRHIQEVEAGVEPSESGFAIEFAAKLRAAIDSGADPNMPLEEAMQLSDVMAPFEPKPAGPSAATLERMERFKQKIQEMNTNSSVAPPPKFEM